MPKDKVTGPKDLPFIYDARGIRSAPIAYDRYFRTPIIHEGRKVLPQGTMGQYTEYPDTSESGVPSRDKSISIDYSIPSASYGDEENLMQKVIKHELVHRAYSKMRELGGYLPLRKTLNPFKAEFWNGDPAYQYASALASDSKYGDSGEAAARILTDDVQNFKDLPLNEALRQIAKQRMLQNLKDYGLGRVADTFKTR